MGSNWADRSANDCSFAYQLGIFMQNMHRNKKIYNICFVHWFDRTISVNVFSNICIDEPNFLFPMNCAFTVWLPACCNKNCLNLKLTTSYISVFFLTTHMPLAQSLPDYIVRLFRSLRDATRTGFSMFFTHLAGFRMNNPKHWFLQYYWFRPPSKFARHRRLSAPVAGKFGMISHCDMTGFLWCSMIPCLEQSIYILLTCTTYRRFRWFLVFIYGYMR